MEEKIKELLLSLMTVTEKHSLEWKVGTEDGEYYTILSGKIVLYKKDSDSDIYKLTITSDVGATLFRVTIQKHDPMFANAESLYNTILSNVPTGIESIDSILDEINKK